MLGDPLNEPIARLLAARVRTGTWLDQQTFPALQWAVPGVIPEGMGLLTGPPKAGKSWAVLGVGLAVAAGGCAFGKIPTGTPRPCLYLALEDGDRRLQDRCRQLLLGEPIPALFEYVTTSTPAEVPVIIAAWLAQHAGQRPLVMLDTLGKVMPPSSPGESAYARDYRVGGVLKALVDAHPGATLLVVHHIRKQAGEDWMDSTSGTNGLNGAADFTINLNRTRGENSATLRVTGRDVREGEYAMNSVDGSWYLDGRNLDEAERNAEQAKATANLGDQQAEIVRLVNARPGGVRAADVAGELDIDPKDAGTYLLRAEKAGRIRRAERGLYTPVGSVGSVGAQAPTLSASYTSHTSYTTCTACGEPLDALGDSAQTHPGCEVDS